MASGKSEFADLLAASLPPEMTLDDDQLALCARHLELVLETNRQFNLTRITDPREAVIKHVVDSLIPAPLYANARCVLDLGSGPGFPGFPLAIVFPQIEFLLVESTQKKARFLQQAAEELKLPNVQIKAERGEAVLKSLPPNRIDILTARAVGSIEKLLMLLKPVKNRFGKLLLFKGQKAHEEIDAAAPLARQLKLSASIALTYELPEEMGSHCVVEYTKTM